MLCGLASLEEIYRTEHGAVLQCSNKNCYWLEFAGDCTPFKVADFLNFRKQVADIAVDELLYAPASSADLTILMPFRSQRCFVLTVTEVLRLKELLQGAKFMMELPGVIKDCLKVSSLLSC
ncbi:DUF6686 family protein [Olivibacter sp. XZL3]|uniref:DUF6686 family protein n=1 Tax=Olivibacter sp. XZL3 TaxID=1735116 RepID=UPI0010649DDD|nr:DUF6686 family protein [Olivibacter sp. XZL3]